MSINYPNMYVKYKSLLRSYSVYGIAAIAQLKTAALYTYCWVQTGKISFLLVVLFSIKRFSSNATGVKIKKNFDMSFGKYFRK